VATHGSQPHERTLSIDLLAVVPVAGLRGPAKSWRGDWARAADRWGAPLMMCPSLFVASQFGKGPMDRRASTTYGFIEGRIVERALHLSQALARTTSLPEVGLPAPPGSITKCPCSSASISRRRRSNLGMYGRPPGRRSVLEFRPVATPWQSPRGTRVTRRSAVSAHVRRRASREPAGSEFFEEGRRRKKAAKAGPWLLSECPRWSSLFLFLGEFSF